MQDISLHWFAVHLQQISFGVAFDLQALGTAVKQGSFQASAKTDLKLKDVTVDLWQGCHLLSLPNPSTIIRCTKHTKCTGIPTFIYTVQGMEQEESEVSILHFIKHIHSFSIADTCTLKV